MLRLRGAIWAHETSMCNRNQNHDRRFRLRRWNEDIVCEAGPYWEVHAQSKENWHDLTAAYARKRMHKLGLYIKPYSESDLQVELESAQHTAHTSMRNNLSSSSSNDHPAHQHVGSNVPISNTNEVGEVARLQAEGGEVGGAQQPAPVTPPLPDGSGSPESPETYVCRLIVLAGGGTLTPER